MSDLLHSAHCQTLQPSPPSPGSLGSPLPRGLQVLWRPQAQGKHLGLVMTATWWPGQGRTLLKAAQQQGPRGWTGLGGQVPRKQWDRQEMASGILSGTTERCPKGLFLTKFTPVDTQTLGVHQKPIPQAQFPISKMVLTRAGVRGCRAHMAGTVRKM